MRLASSTIARAKRAAEASESSGCSRSRAALSRISNRSESPRLREGGEWRDGEW